MEKQYLWELNARYYSIRKFEVEENETSYIFEDEEGRENFLSKKYFKNDIFYNKYNDIYYGFNRIKMLKTAINDRKQSKEEKDISILEKILHKLQILELN